jgi:hypothetical protein
MTNILQTSKVVTADFIQKKWIEALKRELISEGVLIFHRDKGIIWAMSSPIRETIVLLHSGKTEIYDENDSIIEISDNSIFAKRFAPIMGNIFSGNIEELSTLFNIYFIQNSGKWQLGLKPKKGQIKRALNNIILTGDSKGITSFKITAPNGGATSIEFSNQITDKPLPTKFSKLLSNDN